MKTLPRVVDDRVSLVLTPQAYHNYDPATDIFNHSAFAYWSIMVPGEDAWGHIVCTGQLIPSVPWTIPFALCLLPFPGFLNVPFALCLLPFALGPGCPSCPLPSAFAWASECPFCPLPS